MALQGDGSGIVTIPNAVATGDFSVIFSSLELVNSTQAVIGSNLNSLNWIACFTDGDIRTRVDGTNGDLYNGTSGTTIKYEARRVGATLTTYVDDVLATTNTRTGDFQLNTIFALNGSSIGSMLLSGTLTMTGFSGAGTRTYDFEGSGSTLVDTTSGENGTLSGFTTGGFTDEAAPVLSSPTGTATGATTANGSVTTDEANGTLYYYASTNSSETAATIKASGSSQAVSATGVQNVSFTGLTAETVYYAHYVHDDSASNESNVISSAAFTPSSTIFSADSITGGTLVEGTTRRINLSNAPSDSGRQVFIGADEVTVVDEDTAYVDILIPNLRTFGDLTGQYNVSTTFTVVDGAESSTINGPILPLSGYEVGTITALEGVWGAPEVTGVAVSDRYYGPIISGADLSVGAVPVLPTEQVIPIQYQDLTDGQWKEGFIFTIPAGAADTTKPVITLLGGTVVAHTINTTYTDAGATASDNIDGDITGNIVVTGTVNENAVGIYVLYYNVSDAAGNPADQVSRIVAVTDPNAGTSRNSIIKPIVKTIVQPVIQPIIE